MHAHTRQLHLAGMMTDLPEHVSSEEEISGLVVALHRLLSLVTRNNIAPPSMITIARYYYYYSKTCLSWPSETVLYFLSKKGIDT